MKWGLFTITIGLLILGVSSNAKEGTGINWATFATGLIIVIAGIIFAVKGKKQEQRNKREAALKEEEEKFLAEKTKKEQALKLELEKEKAEKARKSKEMKENAKAK